MIVDIKNARIKLNTGPAKTVAILANTGASGNAPGFFLLPSSVLATACCTSCCGSASPLSASFFSVSRSMPSSPSKIQAPPSGSKRIAYLVPPFFTEKIHGPIPTVNSTTEIPFAFAMIKCPNSCAMTTTPKMIKNRTMPNL